MSGPQGAVCMQFQQPDTGSSTMAEDATSTTGSTDANAATDTGTATGETGASTDATTGDATLSEIKALADELGITPGQLKGRLEASKKWEQRAKANTDAATKAATQAQTAQQQLAAVAQALGLAADEQPDPAQLTAALAERDEILRDMQLERAVEAATKTAQGDTALVVPALMYSGKLDGLDPAADDFSEKLTPIVEELVKSNPKYRADGEFPDLRQGNQGQGAAASNDPNAWLRRMAGR